MLQVATSLNGNDPHAAIKLDERRLLVRHTQGDASAFAELISRYRAPIYSYLVRCGVDPTNRDDLFQEIFSRVHRGARSYQPDRPLTPWLFTIAANVVRTHFRRQKVNLLVFPEKVTPEPQDRAADAFAHVAGHETAHWLESAIADLPQGQREVIILSCVEKMSHDEISQITGHPVATIKTHLHRARRALAAALARRKATAHREVTP